ncbi:hypothetical protein B0H14DRAFT_2570939 [Mycena olivaceomarginata]|nr:hypothetical protein B0H14DRAFT_2570939 [Mycena olivaceomarginata]
MVLEARRSVTDKNCIWIHTFVGFPVKPGKDGNIRTFNLGRISALSAIYESRERKNSVTLFRARVMSGMFLCRGPLGCYAGCRLFANGTMKKRTHHYPSLPVYYSALVPHIRNYGSEKAGIFLGPIEQLDIRGPRRQPFGSRSSSAERVERLAGVANKFRGVQHDGVQFGTRWLKMGTVGIRRDSEIHYEGLEILGGEPKPDFEKCRGANQNRNNFKVWINAANCRTKKFRNSPSSMYSEGAGTRLLAPAVPPKVGVECRVRHLPMNQATVQDGQHVVSHHEISDLSGYGLPTAEEIHQRKEGFAFEEIRN